tara:strand:- start:607 stop:1455 length:849 start_codon:yes stop_codon:yes gene_type:complete
MIGFLLICIPGLIVGLVSDYNVPLILLANFFFFLLLSYKRYMQYKTMRAQGFTVSDFSLHIKKSKEQGKLMNLFRWLIFIPIALAISLVIGTIGVENLLRAYTALISLFTDNWQSIHYDLKMIIIDHMLGALLSSFLFVTIGTYIAPRLKTQTAVILSFLILCVLLIVSYFYTYKNDIDINLRIFEAIFYLTGIILALSFLSFKQEIFLPFILNVTLSAIGLLISIFIITNSLIFWLKFDVGFMKVIIIWFFCGALTNISNYLGILGFTNPIPLLRGLKELP